MPTLQDMQAQDANYAKQAQADDAAKAQQEQQKGQEQPPLQRLGSFVGHVTSSVIDSAVSLADSMYNTEAMRKARDVVAGGITAAANTADSIVPSVMGPSEQMMRVFDPATSADAQHQIENGNITSPIWDHAKGTIMDFRDAVQVQDPTMADNLLQGVGQLALPFAGYSRALARLHGISNMMAAGAVTDATALQPHDMRMADLFALGKHAEGKLGDVFNTISPDGSLLNSYMEFLADRGDETEAEGRFKNVLDGFGGNLIAMPLVHAAATTLKYGTAGVRAVINDAMQGGFAGPGPIKAQRGMVAFHGTANASFDAFDNAKIGTGQGAQSYGYGHYLAENATTGETYQKSLAGRYNTSPPLQDAMAAVKSNGGDKAKTIRQLTEQLSNPEIGEGSTDQGTRDRLRRQIDLIKSGAVDRGQGSLLKVQLNDEHVASMLDLDQPMGKQFKVLNKVPVGDQQKLQRFMDMHGVDLDLSELTGNEFRQLLTKAANEQALPKFGKGETYATAEQETSAYLNSKGIPGSKYLDQKSRITGEGTRNYVVFDGKNIKVVKPEK